jgi:hypothetical protein
MSTAKQRIAREVYDDLLPRWRSLGIFFATDYDRYADPERTILDSLGVILHDAKMLYLISNWIREHGDLIHAERLLSLAKAKELSYEDRMTLGALANFAVTAGYKLDLIYRYAKTQIKKGRKIETSEHVALPVVLGQSQPEPSFSKFGILVPEIIDLSSKITDTKLITETNVWIRNRIFFGCNWRADIYTALGRVKKNKPSTYRLAKDLGCSNETALRIRKSFELLGAA